MSVFLAIEGFVARCSVVPHQKHMPVMYLCIQRLIPVGMHSYIHKYMHVYIQARTHVDKLWAGMCRRAQ